MKEEALDRSMWRNCFGSGFVPDVCRLLMMMMMMMMIVLFLRQVQRLYHFSKIQLTTANLFRTGF